MQNRRQYWSRVLKWAIFFLTVYALILCSFRIEDTDLRPKRFPAQPYELYKCPAKESRSIEAELSSFPFENSPNASDGKTVKRCGDGKTVKRILVINSLGSSRHKSVVSLLNYLKVPIRVESVLGDDDLLLEMAGEGRFSLFVFEDYRLFDDLSQNAKNDLLKYCQKYSVGIISFLTHDVGEIDFSQFTARGKKIVKTLQFSSDSPVHFIAKPSAKLILSEDSTLSSDWTFLDCKENATSILDAVDSEGENSAVEILVKEPFGVPHIIFGHDPSHWMIRIALLDALSFAASTIADRELERYIQVDIDDVFVGQSGTKFMPADVTNLLETQTDLRKFIEGFTFLLGFSGYFFRHGDSAEVLGDEQLVASGDQFLWFPHMWRHNHAHEYTNEYLQALMTQNKMFAESMKMNVSTRYAISPQHSSVYPIYEPLYRAWRTIWNVSVTSTEEYPHFRPASARRAFVHEGVSVLPRQICGLFTHTFFFHAYPDCVQKLYENVYGGELFTTILMNKFSIFMTHQQNYANDRLGSFTFQNIVRFLGCWTNMKLKWTPPENLARKYFEKFPSEKQVFHTNPCQDPRHVKMLNASTSCNRMVLPNLVILGPQKTGTTALSLFLSLHPNVSTNKLIAKYFEELQFFGGANYDRGVEWYAEKFSGIAVETTAEDGAGAGLEVNRVIFEKSANYFDSVDAPRAIKALLPDANLVVIMSDPVDRAYSWYQHMLSHNDTTAANFSADEVFMGSSTTLTARLRRRCLGPGMYARHLDRWLDHFPPSQLILVDGGALRAQPAKVMARLAARLNLSSTAVDFSIALKFVPQKGFYCALEGGKLKCLGQGKGRKYAPMSAKLREFLTQFYEPHNTSLRKLLHRYRLPIPSFL